MKNTLALLAFLVFLSSCSPKISKNLLRESEVQLNSIEEIQLIELDENVPMKSLYIGNVKVGESGFTVSCGYDKMILECKKEAMKVGANIVKLTKVKNPNWWSTCYRIEAKLYSNQSLEYLEGKPIQMNFTLEEESTLNLLQGLRQGEFIFYDAEGYNVTLFNSTKPYNPKTIQSLKKKFNIDKEILGILSKISDTDNLIFESFSTENNITTTKSTYIYANNEGTASVAIFSTSLGRIDSFENTILSLILENRIPSTIYTTWEVDSIQFANRFIKLGPICQWRNIRSVQCPKLGQMDWSEFSSAERANKYIEQRIKVTEDKGMSEFVEKAEVPIVFEGVDVIARRYSLKIKAPKLMLGGSNTLTIYYVVAKVEDEYIACVLSHYDNDKNAPELPPLLNEVMNIK